MSRLPNKHKLEDYGVVLNYDPASSYREHFARCIYPVYHWYNNTLYKINDPQYVGNIDTYIIKKIKNHQYEGTDKVKTFIFNEVFNNYTIREGIQGAFFVCNFLSEFKGGRTIYGTRTQIVSHLLTAPDNYLNDVMFQMIYGFPQYVVTHDTEYKLFVKLMDEAISAGKYKVTLYDYPYAFKDSYIKINTLLNKFNNMINMSINPKAVRKFYKDVAVKFMLNFYSAFGTQYAIHGYLPELESKIDDHLLEDVLGDLFINMYSFIYGKIRDTIYNYYKKISIQELYKIIGIYGLGYKQFEKSHFHRSLRDTSLIGLTYEGREVMEKSVESTLKIFN